MARTGFSLKLDFEGLIKKVEEAQGNVDAALLKAAKKCTDTMFEELVSEATSANVPAKIVSAIGKSTEKDGTAIVCRVGWEKPENVDSNNLSVGQIAAILNYGTPARYTRKGTYRGKIAPRNFIKKAKGKAQRKILKTQEDTLNEILGGLRK